MLNDSNISPNEMRSRSGPPSRLAATQEPERKAVLKPAPQVSLAVSPSHIAGMTTRPGSASRARRRAGAGWDAAVMVSSPKVAVAGVDFSTPDENGKRLVDRNGHAQNGGSLAKRRSC